MLMLWQTMPNPGYLLGSALGPTGIALFEKHWVNRTNGPDGVQYRLNKGAAELEVAKLAAARGV
jgi:hypothetical protein